MSKLPEYTEDLSVAPAARASTVRWRIVGLMMAASFFSWFNRVSMSVAGTERIMEEYHLLPTQMGFVYSALVLSYAACMTPGGWLIDRRGAWAALAVMGFGSALCVVLTGVVGLVVVGSMAVWLALIAVRAATGVFMAPIYPGCARAVAHWVPPGQRALANGLVTGAAPFGVACTFIGFGTLIDLFDWPVAFLITGGLTGLGALLWWRYASEDPAGHPSVNTAELNLIRGGLLSATATPAALRSTSRWGWVRLLRNRAAFFSLVWRRSVTEAPSGPPPANPAEPKLIRDDLLSAPVIPAVSRPVTRWDWVRLLENRSLVLLTISYAGLGYFEYLFYFWTEYYFRDVLRLPETTSRLYATVLQLSLGGGIMLGGLMSDRLLRAWGHRWGRVAVPVAGMLLSATFLGIGLMVDDPVALVVCFALALAAGGLCEGPCWATAIDLGGRRGGTAAGIFNTGGNIGGLLAPVVTPWVSSLLGWQWGLALGAIACLLGVILWLGIDPHERLSGEERHESFAPAEGLGKQ
jgi:MFS family permease